jgi:bifunctional non-homologous end joining protein LigD
MLSRSHTPPPSLAGFVEPCLPTEAQKPPSGPEWLHEIKHDGYRLMIRRDGDRVNLLTRNGYDWTDRYPLISAGAITLKLKSCLIDGEAVVCDETGVASFQRMRERQHDRTVILYAFDLLELDGEDLRREPVEVRKATLAGLLRRHGRPGLHFAEHLEGDGPTIFQHACKLGLEGIVSKRKGSRYQSGRSPHWLKSKNPASAAVLREGIEDLNR